MLRSTCKAFGIVGYEKFITYFSLINTLEDLLIFLLDAKRISILFFLKVKRVFCVFSVNVFDAILY